MKKSNLFASVLTSLLILSGCNTTTSNPSSNKGSVPATNSSSVAPSTGTTSSTSSEFTYTNELEGKFNKDTPVTITFWHTMNKDKLQPVLEEIITAFNKTELGKNITVKHEQIGGYDEVRNAVISNIGVGATPNLAYCYPDHVALYRDSRAVETLDTYISDLTYGFTEEERLGFVKGFYDEGRTFGDGKMYSLPFVKSTEVLYYDATFFEANNLSVPTTWDEMWETCKKIKEINPESTPLGYDSEANWFITNAEQRGYLYTSATTKVNGVELGNQGHFRFNNEGNRNFLTELKGYFDKQYFTTKTIFGNYTSNIYKSATKQRAYMVIGSTGGATNQLRTDSVTGIATLPQAAEGKKAKDAAISQGPSICMLKKDNPQESIASWLFLKYLTTNIEAQTSFAKASGYIPASQLAQQSEAYQAYLKGANGKTNEGITALSAKAAVDQTNMYFASPTFVGSSYARDAAGAVMVDVLSKGVSPEDALKNAVASCVSKLS